MRSSDNIFPKPKLFSSRCLGFAACRWNGLMIPDAFIEKLKGHVDFVTTCPEAEIGLGIPREPIRVVKKGNDFSLIQLNTGRDVTGLMDGYVDRYLSSLEEIDGFILKDRSPSCGINNVKVYANLEPGSSVDKTSGFFGRKVLERFPTLAVETEMRLSNYTLREHFLAKLFTMTRFSKIKKVCRMKDLVQFHSENKFLLLSYSQKDLRLLGKIIANHEKKKEKDIFSEYEAHLSNAFNKPSRHSSNINVMLHALGYFSKDISAEERRFFLDSLEEYSREQVPLSVPVNLLKSHVIRFKIDYLSQQTYFEPYPHALTHVTDSGKGRIGS